MKYVLIKYKNLIDKGLGSSGNKASEEPTQEKDCNTVVVLSIGNTYEVEEVHKPKNRL